MRSSIFLWLLFLWTAAGAAEPAPVEPFDGAKLLEVCTASRSAAPDENDRRRAHCVGYIAGVIDAYQALQTTGAVEKRLCLPEAGISPETALQIVLRAVSRESELTRVSGAAAVMVAMAKHYSCN